MGSHAAGQGVVFRHRCRAVAYAQIRHSSHTDAHHLLGLGTCKVRHTDGERICSVVIRAWRISPGTRTAVNLDDAVRAAGAAVGQHIGVGCHIHIRGNSGATDGIVFRGGDMCGRCDHGCIIDRIDMDIGAAVRCRKRRSAAASGCTGTAAIGADALVPGFEGHCIADSAVEVCIGVEVQTGIGVCRQQQCIAG